MIQVISEDDQSIQLKVDNGDRQAINQLLERYGFLDIEALLRYGIVAMIEAQDNTLYVKKGDETIALRPTDKLVKPKTESTDESDITNDAERE
ncbi:MAG TPA: hypothetical protein VLH38_03310 [Patescibacteria group bacterium]|nr:hypothetical protein [Patescibacteria group bacterium]